MNRDESEQGELSGTCECGIELSVSIKCRKILDYMRKSELLKRTLLLVVSK
jgi:hypothetical protein